MNINYLKAGIAFVGLICITVLMATSHLETEAGMPVITLIIGYAVGNGIAAKSGGTYRPIISPKEDA